MTGSGRSYVARWGLCPAVPPLAGRSSCGEWGLPPPWRGLRFNAIHPLDPPKPASAGCDQTYGMAVACRQRSTARPGGQQQMIYLPDGEADPVARDGPDEQTARVTDIAQQSRDGYAGPVLVGVPTRRAVQRGAQPYVEGRQLGHRQLAPAGGVGHHEPPALEIDGRDGVVEPDRL